MADPGWDVDNTCVSIMSTGQVVGVSFIAQSGMISTVAVLIFAALVIRNVIRNRLKPGPNGPQPLIRTHIDGYMISLMFADLLQGLGALMSAKWANEGRVYCSPYCNAQGAIQQVGETGVALSTLVITVHTFITIFFRWQPNRIWWLWIVVVGVIWTFLLTFVLIGFLTNFHDERNGEQPFYGPTPFWCWIKESFLAERILGEYFWLWFCAILNILLYIPLFFTLRGNIQVDPGNWRRIRFHRRGQGDSFAYGNDPNLPHGHRLAANDAESMKIHKAKNKEAMKMFWYPLSYTLLVLPLSIRRWYTFQYHSSPHAIASESITSTAIVLFIFGLSGLVNVLLFMLTRPNLLLFSENRETSSRKKDWTGPNHHLQSGTSFPPVGGSVTVGSDVRRRPGFGPGRSSDSDDEADDRSLRFYPPPPHQPAPLPPPPSSPPKVPPTGIGYDEEKHVSAVRVTLPNDAHYYTTGIDPLSVSSPATINSQSRTPSHPHSWSKSSQGHLFSSPISPQQYDPGVSSMVARDASEEHPRGSVVAALDEDRGRGAFSGDHPMARPTSQEKRLSHGTGDSGFSSLNHHREERKQFDVMPPPHLPSNHIPLHPLPLAHSRTTSGDPLALPEPAYSGRPAPHPYSATLPTFEPRSSPIPQLPLSAPLPYTTPPPITGPPSPPPALPHRQPGDRSRVEHWVEATLGDGRL